MESINGFYTISKALSLGGPGGSAVTRAALTRHCVATRIVTRRLRCICDSSLLRKTASPPHFLRLRDSTPRFVAYFASSGGGDGGFGGESGGGGGGGSGPDGGDADSKLAAAAEGGEGVSALPSDVIILDVGGMSCGGCVASVKRILESQPQVSSASVNLTTETAVVWPVAEAKDSPNWQAQLGEALAKHLTNCGFKSNLRVAGEAISEGDISP